MDNISTKAEAEGNGETETLTRAKRKVTNSLVTNTFKLASDEDFKIIKRLFVRTGTGKSSRSSHSSEVWQYFGDLYCK